mgnify:FL=1
MNHCVHSYKDIFGNGVRMCCFCGEIRHFVFVMMANPEHGRYAPWLRDAPTWDDECPERETNTTGAKAIYVHTAAGEAVARDE